MVRTGTEEQKWQKSSKQIVLVFTAAFKTFALKETSTVKTNGR